MLRHALAINRSSVVPQVVGRTLFTSPPAAARAAGVRGASAKRRDEDTSHPKARPRRLRAHSQDRCTGRPVGQPKPASHISRGLSPAKYSGALLASMRPATPGTNGPLVIAHRTGSHEGPPNSVLGLTRAMGTRAPPSFVEVDVHLSADAQAVVVHGPDLSEDTSGSGWVRDLSVADLSAMRVRYPVGHPCAGAFSPVSVPTLSEFLAAHTGARVMIELKANGLRLQDGVAAPAGGAGRAVGSAAGSGAGAGAGAGAAADQERERLASAVMAAVVQADAAHRVVVGSLDEALMHTLARLSGGMVPLVGIAACVDVATRMLHTFGPGVCTGGDTNGGGRSRPVRSDPPLRVMAVSEQVALHLDRAILGDTALWLWTAADVRTAQRWAGGEGACGTTFPVPIDGIITDKPAATAKALS